MASRTAALLPRRPHGPLYLVLAIAAASACTPKLDEGDEPSTGTTQGPASASDTSAAEPGPTSDPSASVTGDPSASVTSDPSASVTGDPDTATDATGDTDPIDPPPACSESEPGVTAAFEFTEAWFSPSDKIVTPCTVDAVDVADATITTTLSCDTEDGPQAAILRMAASDAGAPTWAGGDAVLLRTSLIAEPGFEETWRHFDLRRADQSLLAVGIDRDTTRAEWTAPIVLDFSSPCGPVGTDLPEVPFQEEFTLGDETLALIEGHRGVLPIDDLERFAIDVQRAKINLCCHFESGRWQHLLTRRVTGP